MKNKFPNDFFWGTATASYQIEGATDKDGKSKSIWDTFTHTPGKVKNNENGDTAVDHYHRYEEDIELMANINLNSYRFSLAWTRIIPEGIGKINPKGVDFYSRLIDKCLEKNIEPFITLYHWDLPQSLQDKGGWANRDMAKIFSDYSEAIVKNFGDRCNHFITFNEPQVFTIHGYVDGYMAPGYKDLEKYFASIHNVNVAHGKAFQAMKSLNYNIKIGCTFNMAPCIPATKSSGDLHATKLFDTYWNRSFADPMYLGRYPELLIDDVSKHIQQDDMKNIFQKNDFIGLNHYQHIRIKADNKSLLKARGAFNDELPFGLEGKDAKLTLMGWEIVPDAYYDQIMDLKNNYGNPDIYLTENGAAYPDLIEKNGEINDNDRIDYFKRYLSAVKKSIDNGAKVKSYFAWTFMDNFEWALGFEKRFGIVHVDFKTLKRTPKKSYYFFKKLVEQNSIPLDF